MRLISIDPGIRHCGIAVWQDYKLINAQLIKGSKAKIPQCFQDMVKSLEPHLKKLDLLIIEYPKIYSQRRLQKGDPKDLLNLAALCGAISSKFKNVTYLEPKIWKGQTKKHVTEYRVKKHLSKEELNNIKLPCKYLQHNVYDAVGIGLWYIKNKGPIVK